MPHSPTTPLGISNATGGVKKQLSDAMSFWQLASDWQTPNHWLLLKDFNIYYFENFARFSSGWWKKARELTNLNISNDWL